MFFIIIIITNLINIILAGALKGLTKTLPPQILNVYGSSSNAFENDIYLQMGFLNVALYPNIDPTGQTDSLNGLTNAIDDSREYDLVAFIPVGTYLISDTLEVIAVARGGSAQYQQHRNHQPQIKGEKRGEVVIKLMDNTFDNGVKKPVIWIWTQKPGDPTSELWSFYNRPKPGGGNSGFSQMIMDIDIDIGNGNPDAIGLRFAAAQGSIIERVNVYSSTDDDFYCCFFEFPARSSGGIELKCTGGDYGFLFGDDDEVSSYSNGANTLIIGAELVNQKILAVYTGRAWTPHILIGFKVVKQKNPAFLFNKRGWSAGGTMFLSDGTIEIENDDLDPAKGTIQSDTGQSVYIEDVYIKGSENIILYGSSLIKSKVNGTKNTWNHLIEYNYCDLKTNDGHISHNIIDHVKNKDEILNLNVVELYPSDIISRHLFEWPDIFEAVNVRDHGIKGDGKECALEIQALIDKHEFLFFPKGDYVINQTIVLKENSKLIGAGKAITRFKSSSTWKPTSPVPMITTVSVENSNIFFARFSISAEIAVLENDFFAFYDWKAGNSTIYAIDPIPMSWVGPNVATNPEKKQIVYSDNAGGRVYFQEGNWGLRNIADGFLMTSVENTKNPLTIYGLNLERGSQPHIQIKDSKNVRIFGMKTETQSKGYLKLVNSQNIQLVGACGPGIRTQLPNDYYAYVDQYSENILITLYNMIETGAHAGVYTFIDEGATTSVTIDYPQYLSLFKRGKFDKSVFKVVNTKKDDDDDKDRKKKVLIFVSIIIPCSVIIIILVLMLVCFIVKKMVKKNDQFEPLSTSEMDLQDATSSKSELLE